jgi:hypothetical protein
MVFAGQRMAGRGLERKDTHFRIRGRDRTSSEVKRYWRRRQINPEEFSPISTTPPDVRYWTPPPRLLETSLLQDRIPILDEVPASLHQTSFHPFCDGIAQNIWQQPIVLSSLTSPGHLRDLESLLHGARDHYEMCIQHAVGSRTTSQQSPNTGDVDAFHRDVLAAASHINYGFPASAQTALGRALAALPGIVRDPDPRSISFLACIIPLRGRKKQIQIAQVLLRSIARESIAICSASHPIVTILQAILRSVHMMQPFVEVLMQLGVETLTRSMGTEDPWTYETLDGLQDVRWQSGDFASVLRHYETMSKSSKLRTTQSEDHKDRAMHMQLMMAYCHLELRNHGEAAKLIEDGLAICATHELNTRSRIFFNVLFLRLQADLARVLGLPGAMEALQEALVIGREIYGVGDPTMMNTADQLERLLRGRGADNLNIGA